MISECFKRGMMSNMVCRGRDGFEQYPRAIPPAEMTIERQIDTSMTTPWRGQSGVITTASRTDAGWNSRTDESCTVTTSLDGVSLTEPRGTHSRLVPESASWGSSIRA